MRIKITDTNSDTVLLEGNEYTLSPELYNALVVMLRDLPSSMSDIEHWHINRWRVDIKRERSV